MTPGPVIALWLFVATLFWLTSYVFPDSYRRLLRGSSVAFVGGAGVLMFAWFYWPMADCTQVPWWFYYCEWPTFND